MPLQHSYRGHYLPMFQVRVSERAQRDQLTKLRADMEFMEAQRRDTETRLNEKEQALFAAQARAEDAERNAHMAVCTVQCCYGFLHAFMACFLQVHVVWYVGHDIKPALCLLSRCGV